MQGHISQKISLIKQEIPDNVHLIGITKQVDTPAMRSAYHAGIRDFGENRLQEALAKQEELSDLKDVSWHFIGHIQKNKAKKVIENFDWIHSVDSLALAKRMNRLADELGVVPKIFLQVKVLADPNKYGWEVENLLQDLAQLDECESLNIRGLMTILPWGLSPSEVSKAFKQVAELSTEIEKAGYSRISMSELSMGMSGDYKSAIEAGASYIRLGRTIFGERNKR